MTVYVQKPPTVTGFQMPEDGSLPSGLSGFLADGTISGSPGEWYLNGLFGTVALDPGMFVYWYPGGFPYSSTPDPFLSQWEPVGP